MAGEIPHVTSATRTTLGVFDTLAWLAEKFEPWLLLAMRLWLAEAFLVLQITMTMSGRGLDAAFAGGFWWSLFQQVADSGPGAVIQAVCPILVALGLLSRPAAVAMLLQVLFLRHESWQHLHAFWIILLVGLVVLGPGAFAVDRLIGPGVSNSALPGGRRVASGYRALSARGVAPYLLILRVVVAAVLIVPHIAPATTTGAMMTAMLPPATGAILALPLPIAIIGALLLLTGFGSRTAAAALLLAVPTWAALRVTDDSLYWILMLGLIVVEGGGAFSIDRLVVAGLRSRMDRRADDTALPHVVVVGGGFGGYAAARGLRDAPCRVTIIDHCNHHLFQPLLYQVATAGLSPADIATPIRGMFRQQANVRVLLGGVTGVDISARAVVLGERRIAYDTLVLATGARHSYFNHEEWSGLAPGLKTIEDATAIRRRLLIAFEAAEAASEATEREAWLTFVIVGGGPTGVELAGAIAELARFGMAGEFTAIDPARARIVLVQSAPRLLPSFPESLSREAANALRRLGVELQLKSKAEAIDESGVTTAAGHIPARTVLWAAGVMASPAAAWLGVEPDRAGRLRVGPDLRVPGYHEIYAIGDTCASSAWKGQPVPGLAPAAKQGGAYVARVITAALRRQAAPAPFVYHHYGSLATIGRKAAVADFGRLRFTGALAWWLWGAAHVAFLIGGRSRAGVVLEWLWDYFTLRRGSRLIVGKP